MSPSSPPPEHSARISPTAHYTGYVWYRHGLSGAAFRTAPGAALFHAVRPLNALSRALGGPHLEAMLLARHQMIDQLLTEAIESGAVTQVVEVAAGLSPRGARFMGRHGDSGLIYVEADLPGMCAQKRQILAETGPGHPRHYIVEVDALADDGPMSLDAAVAPLLDVGAGTALITEGLLSYFDKPAVEGMWRRFARFLRGFPRGRYLSNFQARDQVNAIRGARLFSAALGVFARGKVHSHYPDADAGAQGLVDAGFASSRFFQADDFADTLDLPSTRDSGSVYVFEARTA